MAGERDQGVGVGSVGRGVSGYRGDGVTRKEVLGKRVGGDG